MVLISFQPIKTRAAVLSTEKIQEYQYNEEQKELSDYLTSRANAYQGTYQGSCVIAVRQFLELGWDQIHGYARNTPINSQVPAIGEIIVLNLSKFGHVGVIISLDDGIITYYDSNGDWQQRGAIRTIRSDDARIIGYNRPGK